MKTAELQALGLNQEQIDAVFKINGLDVENAKAAKDKEIAALTTERDDLSGRLQTAEETLKGFEGIDPTEVKAEVEKYKQQAADAEKNYAKKLTERDQRDWLKGKLDEYGVASPYARRQLTADAMDEASGLKWKDGAYFGFDDFMKAAKEKDAGLYQTAEEKKAAEEKAKLEGKAPAFVGPTGQPTPQATKYVPPKIF